jgi:hypothetical protein
MNLIFPASLRICKRGIHRSNSGYDGLKLEQAGRKKTWKENGLPKKAVAELTSGFLKFE